jgi:hypothetical protein
LTFPSRPSKARRGWSKPQFSLVFETAVFTCYKYRGFCQYSRNTSMVWFPL